MCASSAGEEWNRMQENAFLPKAALHRRPRPFPRTVFFVGKVSLLQKHVVALNFQGFESLKILMRASPRNANQNSPRNNVA